MSEHPDDTAYLDTLRWQTGWTRGYCDRCDRCEHPGPTLAIGHIEACSGPGYEIRHCRACIAVLLERARVAARRAGGEFQPTLPVLPGMSPD